MKNALKILVVDDDQMVLDSLKALLKIKGYETDTTNSAQEALKLINRNIFDLVLLDVMMPEMTGFELLDSLDRESLDTMFMIMTGDTSMDFAIEALRKMANDYIRKPFEPEELLVRVEMVLKQKKMRDERKNVEIEKKSLEKQLQHSQKMETIGTLAGGIAHDFNNMLGIIIGSAELAIESVNEDDPVIKYINKILTASTRAEEMVKRLLSFSRLADSEKRPLNLRNVLDESLKLLRSSLQTNIEITGDMPDKTFPILANATQMNQVIINLCNNAAHAMERFGGVLRVRLEDITLSEKHVDFADLSPGKYVCLTVSDNGHGIDPKIIDRIFDPYFTTKEAGKGTGMGLAMVHGIVKNHGGGIRVSSEPGKGTRFDVLFPVINDKVVEVSDLSKTVSPKGRERILLVDDEEMIADTMKNLLEKLGYNVVSFCDSQKAFEEFRSRPLDYDLIITDLIMPGMTGDVLVKKIRSVRTDIPIIMSTGYNEKIDDERARDMGIMEIMPKPVRMNGLAKKVRSVLDSSSVERRTSRRFMASEDTFVVPGADSKVRFDMIDISEKGLAFRYFRDGESMRDFDKFSIITGDEKFVMSGISYKTISDIELFKDLDSLDVSVRRRGVQFDTLTPLQEKMLGYFIENHTSGALN
ncbi:MAG: response regulator [Deltaproteobacteria bacterium]|nr:response regulator [Deltaproteobacteria bacterium]